ncbi:MAG: multicopper oxidase domain-containing protein, partial [Gemmatimonadota bacterium]
PGPFTLTTTPEGHHSYELVAALEGLPEPASLGPYSTYVAWVASPLFRPVIKLGEVGNGTRRLGRVELNKFLVLISAERSRDVEERRGRLVLRGQSPSTRMRPADFLEFLMGAANPRRGAEGGAGHGDRPPSPSPDAPRHAREPLDATWLRPPTPAGVVMLPALMQLEPPSTSPYLPRSPAPTRVPWARPWELLRLADRDSLALEAGFVRRSVAGRTFLMYGFNGQVPGPLLQVPKGATITVKFTNRIDAPTTIHWHGVRLENPFDGVPGVTQEPVPPGGRFRYRVRFPDAGIYWYHPHVREDVQQDLGLYGNILVRPHRSDYFGPAHREEVLMLDDLLLGSEGPLPYGGEEATHTLMGRFGNVLLVNGEPRYALEARPGEVVRFFLTNVSNTRTFNLSFGDAPMKVVGSDVGNFEREAWVESVVLAPAERYVVHVRFPGRGAYALRNRVQATDHLNGRFFPQEDTLGVVRVRGSFRGDAVSRAFSRLRTDSVAVREIDRFRAARDRPPERRLVLEMEARDLPLVVQRLLQRDSAYFRPAEWSGTMPMMNWISTPEKVRWILRDPDTGRENEAIQWSFRVGDVVKLRIANRRETLHAMQHPIHLHGQRFLIVAQDGVPNENLVWKDTVLVPVGSTVDLLVELTNPGKWMLHCHIAEHLEAGMRMTFTVH